MSQANQSRRTLNKTERRGIYREGRWFVMYGRERNGVGVAGVLARTSAVRCQLTLSTRRWRHVVSIVIWHDEYRLLSIKHCLSVCLSVYVLCLNGPGLLLSRSEYIAQSKSSLIAACRITESSELLRRYVWRQHVRCSCIERVFWFTILFNFTVTTILNKFIKRNSV